MFNLNETYVRKLSAKIGPNIDIIRENDNAGGSRSSTDDPGFSLSLEVI